MLGRVARVCAILYWVWSSIGVCLSHLASGMIPSYGVFVSFCIGYGCVFCGRFGRQLACLCHCIRCGCQLAYLCNCAPGMVVSWPVCVISQQVLSLVGISVSF